MFLDYVFRPVLGFLWLLLFILVCFAPEGAAEGGVFAPCEPSARAQDSEDRKLFLVQDSGAAEASEVPAHSYYAQYQSGQERRTNCL